MDFSIASYSFHRLLESGQQDMFKYITDCKELGCTHLDPWNGHLEPLVKETKAFIGGRNTVRPQFSPGGLDYAKRVREAVDEAGLPVACLAVDGAHIWAESPQERHINRMNAYRWLDVAEILGAQNMRVDTGGTPDMPDEQFEIIVEGYKDIIARAAAKKIGIVLENHWGASNIPANVVKVIEAVPGLGLLFDTNNWAEGMREEGWSTCAQYAKSVHIKTREFNDEGEDPTTDIPRVIRLLVAAGYDGVWGIESVPIDGDEYGAAKKTMTLIQKTLEERYV